MTEAFATLAWYRKLERRLQPFSSPAEFERKVVKAITSLGLPRSPLSASQSRQTKWSTYKSGRHTPSPGLVAAVEEIVPGSADVLSHVFFSIADNRCGVAAEQAVWRSRLRPLDQLAFLLSEQLADGSAALRGFDHERLLHADPFDSLATALLAMRIAAHLGRGDLAILNAVWLAKSLTYDWTYLIQVGIAHPLADYLGIAFVDPLEPIGEWSIIFNAETLNEAATHLMELATIASPSYIPSGFDPFEPYFSHSRAGFVLVGAYGHEQMLRCMPPFLFRGRKACDSDVLGFLGQLERMPAGPYDPDALKLILNEFDYSERFAGALRDEIETYGPPE